MRHCTNYLGKVSWFICLTTLLLIPTPNKVATANIFLHESSSSEPNPPADIIVGAYYYPWHKQHFKNQEGYLRRFLEPRQEIRLGEYDDTQPEVITQHLAWSKQANINVWITSWWGPNSGEDRTIRDVILPHPGLAMNNHKIALLYETTGRIKPSENFDTFRLASDMEHICITQDYLNHPNYFKIQGRPVLVIYLTRLMERQGKLTEILGIIRGVCPDIYIIGDQVWGRAPDEALAELDAVTNYDIYGNMGRPRYAGQEGVNRYYQNVADWKEFATANNAGFIPSVSPGYNDRGIRLEAGNPALSRRLTEDSPEGSLFAAQLMQAVKYLDPAADNFMLVNSFNEFHEDTQIEPVDGKLSKLPNELTQGLEYVGYGTLYLDILHAYTSTRAPSITLGDHPVRYTGRPYGVESINLAGFFYPWFTEEHFNDGLRANLDPPQELLPSFLPSSFQDDLQLSWQSNIRTWIMPWNRPLHITDRGASAVFNDPYFKKSPHRAALLYYPHLRVTFGVSGSWDTSLIESDIHHLCQHYLSDSRYYKKLSSSSSSSKPILFLALTRVLHQRGSLEAVVDIIRTVALDSYEIELYLVGDQVWGAAPSPNSPYSPFQLLDAVMNFDVYGNMGLPQGYLGETALGAYFEEQRQWRVEAWKQGCSFVPTVMPGYNDRAARLVKDNPALSRKLSDETDGEGSLFAASLDKAQHLLDGDIDNLMIINSLNHFFEDTQIYPVRGEATNLPYDFTQGLTYTGYEDLYLNLLTNRYGSFETPAPTPILSISPSSAPSRFPSKMPTILPSASPSRFPTVSPSDRPTKFRSEFPTLGSTASPVTERNDNDVTGSCEDDPYWLSDEKNPRSCEDIAVRVLEKPDDLAKTCKKDDELGIRAYEACPSVCDDACNPQYL